LIVEGHRCRAPNHLLCAVAEHFLSCTVKTLNHAVEVGGDDGVIGTVENSLLQAEQMLDTSLALFAFSNVAHTGDEIGNVVELDASEADFGVEFRSVKSPQAPLKN